jgi:uncharacterized protein YgiB involved in biofilm formation
MYKRNQPLQTYPIYRLRIHRELVIAAMIAILLSGCGGDNPDDESEEDAVKAVFYENAQQCEVEAKKQQASYQTQIEAFQNGKLTESPSAPIMQAQDCEAQMLAALQEYNRTAPTYASLNDCQSEGVRCEPYSHTSVSGAAFRPVFGGSYFYPYGDTDLGHTTIYMNGTPHHVYPPRSVFQSNHLGQVVTANGQVISKSQPGAVEVSRSTTVSAPQRPAGIAAKGTIRGRSSSGFGSTFKSTGRGGK